MDPGAGARVRAPRPRSRGARTMVTPADTRAGAACERAAGRDFERAAGLLARELPRQNHPLTRAYLLGARSTTQSAYTEALRLIRACETDADQLTIDQCKLAADVMIERKMP